MTPSPGRPLRLPPFSGLVAAALALLAARLPAPLRADTSGEGPAARRLALTVTEISTDGAPAYRVGGELPDAQEAMSAELAMKNVLGGPVLAQQVVRFDGRSFSCEMGPFITPLCPGTYTVEGYARPAASGGMVAMGTETALFRGAVTWTVGTPPAPADQLRQIKSFAQGLVARLRASFLEIETRIPQYKAQFAKTGDTAEAEAWFTHWTEGLLKVQADLEAEPGVRQVGYLLQRECGLLMQARERLMLYGNRTRINITGRERFDAADEGKSWSELEREGKMPSRIVREQFLVFFASVFQGEGLLEDPNRVRMTEAARVSRETFVKAYGRIHGVPPAEKGAVAKELEGALSSRVDAAVGEVLPFFVKRREIAHFERPIQEEADRLARLAAALHQLAALYRDKPLDDPQTLQIEHNFVHDLVAPLLERMISASHTGLTRMRGNFESAYAAPAVKLAGGMVLKATTGAEECAALMADFQRDLAELRGILKGLGSSFPGSERATPLVAYLEALPARIDASRDALTRAWETKEGQPEALADSGSLLQDIERAARDAGVPLKVYGE